MDLVFSNRLEFNLTKQVKTSTNLVIKEKRLVGFIHFTGMYITDHAWYVYRVYTGSSKQRKSFKEGF